MGFGNEWPEMPKQEKISDENREIDDNVNNQEDEKQSKKKDTSSGGSRWKHMSGRRVGTSGIVGSSGKLKKRRW